MTDYITLLGLALGLAAIVGGQVLEGGNVASLAQLAALVIVLGGTVGAVMVQSPLPVFKDALRLARWVVKPPPGPSLETIRQIGLWSQVSRREGTLALENYAHSAKDPFIKKGLQLLADGVPPELMRSALGVEISAYEARHRAAARVWEAAGGYAPTIGIIGAVLGLIHVMEHLSDPSKLGAGIAVAFVATIYGVGLANLVFLPIAGKLKGLVAGQVAVREMIIDGLAGIGNGENPRLIESRLSGYLPPPPPSKGAKPAAKAKK
ncbi:Chemotaxis protein PomA [Burkholderiales bacterium]|nr:Chemotaxis protein PomA [Burkholderiales bacterium]